MQNGNHLIAKRYSKIKHNLALFELGLTLIFLLIAYISGVSFKIKLFADSLTSNQLIIIAIYIFIFSLFFNLLTFWLDYLQGYWLERRFNLSRQKFISWLKDHFKKLAIGGLFYLIIIEVLYFFLKNYPYTWWIWTSIFWLFFSLVIAKIFPVFIIPLFYKLEKLKDEGLKNKLLGLAKRAKIKVVDIYSIGLGAKTVKANAALTGLGKSKRILLSDTLLNNYSQEEIEATLAHELAHHKYHHIWKLIAISLFATIFSFLFVSILYNYILIDLIKFTLSDIVLFPLLAFIFMSLNIIFTPFQNAVSRYFESQADKEAISLTGRSSAFASLIEKLTKQNLSDPNPSKLVEIFFYDHPPAAKRIRAAKMKI